MKVFSSGYLNELTAQAQYSPRQRYHRNIHESYSDPCQRLFNAIEPNSYIRPHRHAIDPRDELLIAIRGVMALVTFNEKGRVTKVVRFGADRNDEGLAIGIEISANTWHTVLALEQGCVLLEIKAGPFDPNRPKDLAPWAPCEGLVGVGEYLNNLRKLVESITPETRMDRK
jgi:cupin fold WbuC family metalloprotein